MRLISIVSTKIKTFALVFAAATAVCNTNVYGQNLKNHADSLSYALGVSLQQGLKMQGIDTLKSDLMCKSVCGSFSDLKQAANPEVANPMAVVNQFMSEKMQQQPITVKVENFSYALGVLVAQNLKQQGLLNEDFIAAAFSEGFGDSERGAAKMGFEQANQLINNHLQAAASKQFESKIAEGKKFLDENGKRPGVVTTPSGLQYEVLKQGVGSSPTSTDQVTTHYHGTLLSGKVFDSSVERGQPIDFPVNGVIAGWTEALQLMKTGAKYRLYLPYNLAYGERGAGGSIGPYETLIFDVELLKVNGKD